MSTVGPGSIQFSPSKRYSSELIPNPNKASKCSATTLAKRACSVWVHLLASLVWLCSPVLETYFSGKKTIRQSAASGFRFIAEIKVRTAQTALYSALPISSDLMRWIVIRHSVSKALMWVVLVTSRACLWSNRLDISVKCIVSYRNKWPPVATVRTGVYTRCHAPGGMILWRGMRLVQWK